MPSWVGRATQYETHVYPFGLPDGLGGYLAPFRWPRHVRPWSAGLDAAFGVRSAVSAARQRSVQWDGGHIWLQNPYLQFFTGDTHLQTEFSIDPSILTRWRQRIGEERIELLLALTIEAARAAGLIKRASLEK